MLNAVKLAQLDADTCPDCGGMDFVRGPRGGLGQNTACKQCGAEFNIVRATIDHGTPEGPVVMAMRNSARDAPNRRRLREVFGIDLPEPDADRAARERAAAAYYDPSQPDRRCDRCGEGYRGPAVYCSWFCAWHDAEP